MSELYLVWSQKSWEEKPLKKFGVLKFWLFSWFSVKNVNNFSENVWFFSPKIKKYAMDGQVYLVSYVFSFSKFQKI